MQARDLVLAEGQARLDAQALLPLAREVVLQVTCEVLEVTPSQSRPDRGRVRMRNETRNQRDEVVQSFVVTLVVPRRTAQEQP